jgi:hypothetical protein
MTERAPRPRRPRPAAQREDVDAPMILEAGGMRMSAEAMRGLKKATGRSMSDLLHDDDDEANRIQVMAFAELHRRAARLGHLPDAGTLWERAGLVDIDFVAPEAVDPLGGGSSTTSPPSAATGA